MGGKLLSFQNRTSQNGQSKLRREGLFPVFSGTETDLINKLRPALPLYILRPKMLQETATTFVNAFPGKTMYAVKTNPSRAVIENLIKGGINAFDAASIEEVRLVRSVAPKAEVYYMHPVKTPESIREAYFRHGVRHFVLDCEDELYKIMRETGLATDLKLHVRLSLPKNEDAYIDFSSKFGAKPVDAIELLRKCRSVTEKLGICFHVGTQILNAQAFAKAISLTKTIIVASGVRVDCLDVGGGFPVSYVGDEIPSLHTCMHTITRALREADMDTMELLAEPGRALVAESGSLVVRVELRKDNTLYLNDGTYGGLFDAGPLLGTRFPVVAYRHDGVFEGQMADFSLAGPTCDSLDMMEGPFALPADIRMGDWIEVKNLGAYSQSMRTNFNGFGASDQVLLI